MNSVSTWKSVFASVLLQAIALVFFASGAWAQETTAGLQGTVKDASGAVVKGAQVTVSSTTLVGEKAVKTDARGYYRLANLPPGNYVVTVSAEGFATTKNEGLALEVGHLPTLDFSLQVGKTQTVVEVSGEAPAIDVTTNHTMTNITTDVISDVPHGRSFQSVIQFAPSARNEPLEGSAIMSNGTGGTSPGNGSNGSAFGYSVGGGADSENAYLVEGQETANLIGGYSHTNVPFDFIQEVQIKSSGIEAEHGGALGGVVNVVMKKGTNGYHGAVFAQFENDAMDGSPPSRSRYNAASSGTPEPWGTIDPAYENYQPVRRHTSDVFPGFTFGGPIKRDKVFFFVASNPEWSNQERFVNYGPTNGGMTPFSQNQQTYYTTARIDAALTQKIRVFGSWLYQYQRETGEDLPLDDATGGYFNSSTGCFGQATSTGNPCLSSGVPKFVYGHNLGFAAPNSTTNVGADITISPTLVATTRFGYYFENYHDFGYPTTGTIDNFQLSGIGGADSTGAPLPASLQQSQGYFNIANNQNYTLRNANKAIQFDQDVLWIKSGWLGTHNFKFGYQLNRLSNDLAQRWNAPYVQVFPYAGNASAFSPATDIGTANCAAAEAADGTTTCQGRYGYINVQDFGSSGKVTSYNHGFFAQDAWTVGHGVTMNLGVRVEKEYLPGEGVGQGVPSHPIDFSWTDKIAPRLGVAWDVFRDGRMKVFGSYGQFYDMMKLNVAISSFGGQYWQNCYYALDTPDLASVQPAFASGSGRDCVGPSASSAANWTGGATPAGLTFLENQNFRTFPTTCSTCSEFEEGVAPNLKPYEQHESVFGVDYQLAKNVALEARWDRRRLDHVIEDSAIAGAGGSETFVIVNPGQGINENFQGFYDFLYPNQTLNCSTSPCPPNKTIPAARSYDGMEIRLTKTTSQHWAGMFSYTYSRLRGNYTGLTSSDIADGTFGGRNSPNNSRSFDEPYFSWNSMGGSSSGLLPTDRPNAFKGYGYYELGFRNHWTTDLGIFQYAYSGAPTTSFLDVGYNIPGGDFAPVDVVDRGKWVDLTQNPATGAITVGAPRTNRTPWYTQTDFNLQQNYKVSESKVLSFSATISNLLNQHAPTALNGNMDSASSFPFVSLYGPDCAPTGGPGLCNLFNGPAWYHLAMAGYNLSSVMNQPAGPGSTPITVNSWYGKPLYYQLSRNIRLGVKFTF